jgi:hypothetical protein
MISVPPLAGPGAQREYSKARLFDVAVLLNNNKN